MNAKQLRDAAFAGVRWMALARVVAEVFAFATLVVLAHLIPPSAYGHAAIALIVPLLATIVTFEACGAALVQRDSVEPRHFRAATTLALVLGGSLTALTLACAPLVAGPLFGDDVVSLVQLASPAFLISAIAAVSLARLQRRLAFKRISTVEVSGVVVTSLSSLALAIDGLDAEAVIGGALAGSVATTLILVLSARPPVPGIDRRAMAEVARFGVPAALQGLSWVGFRNIDYVVVGARLGAAQVGYYFRAFQFGVEYQGKVSNTVMNLAFPIFSRTEDLSHLRRVHGRIVRTHAVVVYPLVASLIALAPILIPWLLGSRWTPAVVPAQVLAVAGMAFVLMVGTGQAVLAAGHPRAVLVVNLCSFLGYGTTMFFVAPHGLVAVSVAAATFYVLMVVANYQFLLKRYMGIPVRRLIEHAGPAVVSSLALIGVELGVSELTTRLGAPRPAVLALSVVAGLAAYAGAVRLLFPAAWRDCRELVRGLAPGARGGRGRPTVVSEAPDAVVAAAE